LAPASLAATLDALRELLTRASGGGGQQVERVEQALGVLADPAALECRARSSSPLEPQAGPWDPLVSLLVTRPVPFPWK
jgi:hypothetical protein